MPRPRLRRRLCIKPESLYFKPRGVPLHLLKTVTLSREEMETFWLVDAKGYDQNRAARHMRTSQATVQRILRSVRKKTAQALSGGLAIEIVNA